MSTLHPDVEHLAFLLGTWVGEGAGEYPTIEPFTYREETTFVARGASLAYEQRTWHGTTGDPSHAERGYWRPVGRDRIEVLIATSTGFALVEEATIDGTTITVRSSAVGATPTAKRVDEVHRHISVTGDEMAVRVSMAAVGHPTTHHLAATLRRA